MTWLKTASDNFGYLTNNEIESDLARFTSAPSNHKYYEEYTSTSSNTGCDGKICYGHALSETESWYGDWKVMLSNDNPWSVRGSRHYYEEKESSGIFGFFRDKGVNYFGYSFRVILS